MTAATTNPTAKERPVYVIALRPEPHVDDAIRVLRGALKSLLRQHGLRALAVHEDTRGQP